MARCESARRRAHLYGTVIAVSRCVRVKVDMQLLSIVGGSGEAEAAVGRARRLQQHLVQGPPRCVPTRVQLACDV